MITPYIRILQNRNFFFLWFGQIVSQFGDKLTQIALVGLVVNIFGEPSPLAMAGIFSMTIIPVIIFSHIAGVYVDRWSKRKTMYICDFLRGIIILLIPFLFLQAKFFPFICVVIFISSSLGRFFIPAKMALVPQLIDRKKIFLANSLISITATSAAVFGIGVGGFLVDSWGVKAVFGIDAATFFISAIAIFLIAIKEAQHFVAGDILHIGKDVVANVKKSFIRELKEGLKYMANSDEAKYAFKINLFLFSYVGGLFPVYIVYIQKILGEAGSSVKYVGMTGISLGAAAIVGSLIYGRIAHKFSVRRVIDSCIFVASLFLVFFTVTLRIYPHSIYAIATSFVLGLLISPVFVGVTSLIHREGEKELFGRIFSSLEFISHFGFLVAMFISGYLAELTTPFTIMVSIGIIGALFSVIFIFLNVKSSREKRTTA